MATVYVAPPVNPAQLAYEMGAGVRAVGPDPGREDEALRTLWKVTADVDEAVLSAALAAHVADDMWEDPTYSPPPPPTPEEKLAALGLTADDIRAVLA